MVAFIFMNTNKVATLVCTSTKLLFLDFLISSRSLTLFAWLKHYQTICALCFLFLPDPPEGSQLRRWFLMRSLGKAFPQRCDSLYSPFTGCFISSNIHSQLVTLELGRVTPFARQWRLPRKLTTARQQVAARKNRLLSHLHTNTRTHTQKV